MKKKSGKKKSGSKKKNGSKKLWIGLVVCALAIIAIAAGIILRNMRNGWKEMDGVTKYLKNGKEVARLVSRQKAVSFLTDSLTGVLANDYDYKAERAERYERK